MDDNVTDTELDALFDTARAAPPKVPDALMARVVADAQTLQPRARIGWRGWLNGVGGVPALGGLITATCVGFWFGVAPPDSLPDLGGLALGYDSSIVADTNGYGWDSEEG